MIKGKNLLFSVYRDEIYGPMQGRPWAECQIFLEAYIVKLSLFETVIFIFLNFCEISSPIGHIFQGHRSIFSCKKLHMSHINFIFTGDMPVFDIRNHSDIIYDINPKWIFSEESTMESNFLQSKMWKSCQSIDHVFIYGKKASECAKSC